LIKNLYILIIPVSSEKKHLYLGGNSGFTQFHRSRISLESIMIIKVLSVPILYNRVTVLSDIYTLSFNFCVAVHIQQVYTNFIDHSQSYSSNWLFELVIQRAVMLL